MKRALLLLALVATAIPARAAELSVSVGRYDAPASDDAPAQSGSVVRLGFGGSRRPGEVVEVALEGRLGGANGWTGLSVRYRRFLAARSAAQPFVGIGFDAGSNFQLHQPVPMPSLSGHLTAGLRLPLSRTLFAEVALVGGFDADASPYAAVTTGVGWAF